jgi:hypothetical protein
MIRNNEINIITIITIIIINLIVIVIVIVIILLGIFSQKEFLRLRPGCFFFVGANVSEGVPNVADTTQHHSPTFDIDERSLLIGR